MKIGEKSEGPGEENGDRGRLRKGDETVKR